MQREGTRVFTFGLFVLFLLLGGAGAAVATSRDFQTDRRNPEYLLWKAGLGKFEPRFYANMSNDPWGGRLVQGMTVPELRARFGWIRESRDMGVAWLGDSDLAVFLEHGRVTRLSRG